MIKKVKKKNLYFYIFANEKQKKISNSFFSKSFFLILFFTFFLFSLFPEKSHKDKSNPALLNIQSLEKIEFLQEEAKSLSQSDPEKSIAYAKEAISLIGDEQTHPVTKADLYILLADTNHYLGRFDEALSYCQKAEAIYKEANQLEKLASAYQLLGNLYRDLGNYDKALTYTNLSFELNTTIGNANGIGKNHYFLGAIYFFKNDHEKALHHNLLALEKIESNNKNTISYKAAILNFIGRSFELQKEYNKALDYFYEAKTLYETDGDTNGIANTLHNIAMLHDKMQHYEQAIPYLMEALDLLRKTNHKIGIAYTYQNLGIVYFNYHQQKEAQRYFELCLPLFKDFGVQFGLATVYSYLAKIYLAQNQLTAAEATINLCLELAVKMKMKGFLRDAYFVKSEIASQKQDYKHAFLHFKQAAAYVDSVYTEEKNKSITEMQTKYETERKEQENTILKQKNEFNELVISRQTSLRNFLFIVLLIILISLLLIYNQYRLKKIAFSELQQADKIIQTQRDELEQMNKTRNQFFSIVSHDLKNSFSSLQMGADMLSNLENLEKAEMKTISQEMQEIVSNLYKFLENLLEWSRLQIGRTHHEPIQFDISKTIYEVSQIMEKKAKQKQVSIINKARESVVFADDNMVFSVLQNLVYNAIKFSFPKGKIEILQEEHDDKVEILISDNGVGMNSEQLDNLFKMEEMHSLPGTNEEKGTGLGLILCKEFIEKNNGEIWVESELEKGTTVHFTLPKSEIKYAT
jgi:signal transduction histidine kinase